MFKEHEKEQKFEEIATNLVETDKSIRKRQVAADQEADIAGVDLSRLKEDQRLHKKQVEFQKEQEKIKKKM